MSTQWRVIKPSDILSREESHQLRQRSDLRGAWMMLHCWGLIALSMALYAWRPGVWTFLIALIVVGGRQLGLAILMHEGSHGMLFKTRRLNEAVSQWFAAWPLLLNMENYRRRHMAHHRFTRTDEDPENYLYTPFPVSKTSMARKILRDLTGIVFLRTQVGIFRYIAGEKDGRLTRLKAFYGGPVLFYALFITGFALAGRLDIFLLCWLIPLMTTQQFFLRIRNIAEHATVPDLENPLKNSRTTLANPLERLTFAPYFVNYHIEHHMLPFVPCWRLRQVHKIMEDKGFAGEMEIRPGYLDIIKLNAAA
ncbi:fatty acid desaturase family protein [Kordiimonas marina]|uniref:fatty acid desaturase family protein n=1 Tax=Kordiimonas marina TaxID=2872312 RepID=UPI001FF1A5B4|nr:fatty acid desaturase family protein [Kordiimonas marina]MCJ9428521.1 fatty acid desaturase family protein [Kordiimonas marina]